MAINVFFVLGVTDKLLSSCAVKINIGGSHVRDAVTAACRSDNPLDKIHLVMFICEREINCLAELSRSTPLAMRQPYA